MGRNRHRCWRHLISFCCHFHCHSHSVTDVSCCGRMGHRIVGLSAPAQTDRPQLIGSVVAAPSPTTLQHCTLSPTRVVLVSMWWFGCKCSVANSLDHSFDCHLHALLYICCKTGNTSPGAQLWARQFVTNLVVNLVRRRWWRVEPN